MQFLREITQEHFNVCIKVSETTQTMRSAKSGPLYKTMLALGLQWQQIILVNMEPITKAVFDFFPGKVYSLLLWDEDKKGWKM